MVMFLKYCKPLGVVRTDCIPWSVKWYKTAAHVPPVQIHCLLCWRGQRFFCAVFNVSLWLTQLFSSSYLKEWQYNSNRLLTYKTEFDSKLAFYIYSALFSTVLFTQWKTLKVLLSYEVDPRTHPKNSACSAPPCSFPLLHSLHKWHSVYCSHTGWLILTHQQFAVVHTSRHTYAQLNRKHTLSHISVLKHLRYEVFNAEGTLCAYSVCITLKHGTLGVTNLSDMLSDQHAHSFISNGLTESH